MSAEPEPSQATRVRTAASAVFLILFSLYALTYQGQFRVDDEHILAARSQSLATHGRLEQPQVFGNERERELQAMGPAATQIEPGQALVGAVLYRAAVALGLGGAQALFMQNALLTAATASILALSVAALGFGPGIAAAVGLLFGAGTYAWPYATTYFRDPQAMFGLALALHGWVGVTRRGSRTVVGAWAVLIAGVAVGVTTKNAAVIFVPALGAVWLLQFRGASMSARKHRVAFSAGLLVAGLAVLAIPKPEALARFTLDYYWSVARHFLSGLTPGTVIEGTLGPFVSPARSLFLFCPPLVLMAAVPRRWWRAEASLAGVAVVTALGLALAQVLFYREQWAGAVGWGPRAMLLALPGLVLLTPAGIQRLTAGLRGRWLLAGLGTLAIAVQLSAVLIPWQAAHESMRGLGLEAYSYAGVWDIRRLQLIHQVPLLLQFDVWNTAWSRVAAAGSAAWIPVFILCAAGVGGGAYLLRRSGARGGIGVAVAASLAVLLTSAAALTSDPAWYGGATEIGQAIDYARAEVETGDTLLVDAYGTPAWFRMMNEWSSPVRWFSLPFEIPGTNAGTMPNPQPDVEALLEALLVQRGRLLLIVTSDAPDYLEHDEVGWLERNARLMEARTFSGPSRRIDVLTFRPR